MGVSPHFFIYNQHSPQHLYKEDKNKVSPTETMATRDKDLLICFIGIRVISLVGIILDHQIPGIDTLRHSHAL